MLNAVGLLPATMSETQLDQLLYRGESESLDFKRDQYPFVGATDDQKAKLLKDILAMANAWRNETAHILLGVDAPPGATPQVVGITQHLDDAALQQFISAKTQRPVQFRYSEKELQGKTIGVIEIPVQRRPLYTVSTFGGVQAKAVYIRRGSSNAEASPDEIASMGATLPSLDGEELQVAFATPEDRQVIGAALTLDSLDLTLDEPKGVPDYGESHGLMPVLMVNRDYWRDFVHYVTVTELAKPVALTVTNRGKHAAKDVRVEFVIEDPDHNLHFIAAAKMPERPTTSFPMHVASMPQAMAAALKGPPFEAERIKGTWHLAFNLGALQPSRTLFPAIKFFAGAKRSATITLVGRVLAENLPAPAECKLTLHFVATARTMTLDAMEAAYAQVLEADD